MNNHAPFLKHSNLEISDCCYPTQPNQRICDSSILNYNYSDFTSCNEYIFDNSVYKSTTISEFNLVCKNAWLADLTTSLYYAGFGIGGVISGFLSDKYGRKINLIIFAILLLISDIYTAFVPNIEIFSLMRFINGFLANAIIVPGYILTMEYIGNSYRSAMTNFSTGCFAFGIMLLSYPFAYLLNEWRDLQLWICVSTLPTIILGSIFLPKSYKFLISQGKSEEAYEVACNMMVKNKSICHQNGAYDVSEDSKNHLKENIEIQCLEVNNKKENKNASLIDVWQNKNMRKITLNLMFNWFVNSMVYYGLSLNCGSLPGSDIFNNFINGLIEMPAYIVFPFFLRSKRFGRVGTLGYFLILGGICCLASTLFLEFRSCDSNDKDTFSLLGQILAYLGKFCIAGTFAIDYNYAAEIFPAEIRSNGLAICSFAARIAGIISPFILSLSNYFSWLPGVIFAVLAVVAGGLTFFMPETLGRPLLSTMAETDLEYFS